jgi:Holliday junction resolvase RusA-like endonuclease
MKQTLTLHNYHPPTINELLSGHWSKGARLKKRCVGIVWASCVEQKLTKATGKRMVAIEITTNKAGRRADPDAYYKSTLDALVKCGMLVDDSSQWCEHAQTLVRFGDKNETVILLTDIEK